MSERSSTPSQTDNYFKLLTVTFFIEYIKESTGEKVRTMGGFTRGAEEPESRKKIFPSIDKIKF